MIYKTSTTNQPLKFLAGDSLTEATTYAEDENIPAGSRFIDVPNGVEYIWDGSDFVILKDFLTVLSTDTKPATAPNGAKLLEVDTKTWYVFHEDQWYPQ
jgi:hypothetical protein